MSDNVYVEMEITPQPEVVSSTVTPGKAVAEFRNDGPTYFQLLFFGNQVPSLRHIVGKVLAQNLMDKRLGGGGIWSDKCPGEIGVIAMYLRDKYLLEFISASVENVLFDLEMVIPRDQFMGILECVADMSEFNRNSQVQFAAREILESYESDCLAQVDRLPEKLYQFGLVREGSQPNFFRMCEFYIKLWLCKNHLYQVPILGEKVPKISLILKDRVVKISQKEYAADWSFCKVAECSLAQSFETPEDALKPRDHVKSLVLAHRAHRRKKFSEALLILLNNWPPPEEVHEKIDYLSLLAEVAAELHTSEILQFEILNAVSEVAVLNSNLVKKESLVGTILVVFVRCGMFLGAECFFQEFADKSSLTCHRDKSVCVMIEAYFEWVENLLLFVVGFRKYHSRCSHIGNNFSCKEDLCFVQLDEARKILASAEKLLCARPKKDNYYSGLLCFYKYLLKLFLKSGVDHTTNDEDKMHAEFYFRLCRNPEGVIMSECFSGKQIADRKIRNDLGIDTDYFNVDLRYARVKIKHFLLAAALRMAPSKEGKVLHPEYSLVCDKRDSLKNILRVYKKATNGQSYRIRLLKGVFLICVMFKRHFVFTKHACGECEDLASEASFDEEDAVSDDEDDTPKNYITHMYFEPEMCQRQKGDRLDCLKRLMPLTDTFNYRTPHFARSSILEASAEYVLSHDSKWLGKNLFYGIQMSMF